MSQLVVKSKVEAGGKDSMLENRGAVHLSALLALALHLDSHVQTTEAVLGGAATVLGAVDRGIQTHVLNLRGHLWGQEEGQGLV